MPLQPASKSSHWIGGLERAYWKSCHMNWRGTVLSSKKGGIPEDDDGIRIPTRDPETTEATFRDKQINLDDVNPHCRHCNDLPVKLDVNNFLVNNVPDPAWYGEERSDIRYSPYILLIPKILPGNFLWRLKRRYIRFSFHPRVFFDVTGAKSISTSRSGGIFSRYNKYSADKPSVLPLGRSLIPFGIWAKELLFTMFFDMQQGRRLWMAGRAHIQERRIR